jgi:hypothetical protein
VTKACEQKFNCVLEINSQMVTMNAEQEKAVPQDRYRVAIPEWVESDGIAKMIGFELEQIGHTPVLFSFDSNIPKNVDYLLTFGPYNRILPIWQNNSRTALSRRPVVIHWNTEGMPDLRIPPGIIRALGAMRSKIGRMGRMRHSGSVLDHFVDSLRSVSNIDEWFKRYRYQGDYEYACRKGWLHVLSDTSHIYSQIRSNIGIPTLYAPWGSSQRWYQDLGLERDVDVLWMGKRGSRRRGRILDQVFKALKLKGLNVYIGDNEENPFIFGEERTRYLNRAKITLNITRTWYDDNFSRFTMACPNRSLVVSEPVLPHCTEFKENVHYVSAKIEDLANTIIYYLEHEQERSQIVDNAYNLMITELKFERSLRKMFAAAQPHITMRSMK